MGLVADILDLFYAHGEQLSDQERAELTAKLEQRRKELQKALDAIERGLDALGAAGPAKKAKKRPRRKAVKRGSRR
jgi:hypothetical protein